MEGTDLVLKLPQPILEHILSFLPIKDAAKTSILSKVWNNAWISLSCLDFCYAFYLKSETVVEQILANRQKQKMSIQRFRVKLPDSWLMFLDNWIKILVACNIKELFLAGTAVDRHKRLPEVFYAAKDLKVLRLRGFKLELRSDGIKFSSLRELYLSYSFLDEELLQSLCATCCNLEVLSLRKFHGLTSLQVVGTLPKLRTLKLVRCPPKFQMVDIVAPNLTDLYISSLRQDLRVINITACKSIKHLKLTAMGVTDQWLENLLPNLPNLDILYLDHCLSLKTVNISSERLKYFQVIVSNNLIEIDLDTPNLLRFSCDVHLCREKGSPSDVAPTFKLKASHLREAKLNLIINARIGTCGSIWYSKLTKSLGNFNHSKAIALCCRRDKEIVIPKDMREDLLPPLYAIKHLHVKITNWYSFSVADVVDSLLWMSPQLDTLSFGRTGNDLKSMIKFTYRDAADEEPCCESLPWKCWRHELKKVKLQDFTCMEQLELRNYFLTNTDIFVLEGIIECNSPNFMHWKPFWFS